MLNWVSHNDWNRGLWEIGILKRTNGTWMCSFTAMLQILSAWHVALAGWTGKQEKSCFCDDATALEKHLSDLLSSVPRGPKLHKQHMPSFCWTPHTVTAHQSANEQNYYILRVCASLLSHQISVCIIQCMLDPHVCFYGHSCTYCSYGTCGMLGLHYPPFGVRASMLTILFILQI